MQHPIDTAVPRIARNEMFYFIARVCMIASLPIGGFFGQRIISQADALQLTVTQQNIDIKVLSAIVNSKLDANVAQLTDHELRLRSLERSPHHD